MAITKEAFNKVLNEKYLFHLHTIYTDGSFTVQEYFEFAKENQIKTLLFTEHVRRKLTYSFDDFYESIRRNEKNFKDINAVIGAEAKILPDKSLDISDKILNQVDLIAIACHGFPDDTDLYFETLSEIFFTKTEKITVFVHPGRFFKKRPHLQFEYEKFQKLISFAADKGIYIERNKRESLPHKEIDIPMDKEIIGYDVHSKNELKLFAIENRT